MLTKIITLCIFPIFFLILNLTCVYLLAPEKPVVTVRRIDSTSVTVSWTVDSEGIHYFLVTYRKLADGSDQHTINTTQTEIEITGLEPGVEYEFEVSAHLVLISAVFDFAIH